MSPLFSAELPAFLGKAAALRLTVSVGSQRHSPINTMVVL